MFRPIKRYEAVYRPAIKIAVVTKYARCTKFTNKNDINQNPLKFTKSMPFINARRLDMLGSSSPRVPQMCHLHCKIGI
jgi:hypothetical protein